jgi:5,10-methylenetetrahydrofolate reductase
VRNVFVVMGDPTSIGDYPDAMDNYDLVPSGLVKLIKQGFNLGVDHAGSDIGQPTTFFVGCALNPNPVDIDKEVKTLRNKIKAGADFLLTQPIFDPPAAVRFLTRYQDLYGRLEIPVLVGILPLANARHANFLDQEVPGITIPHDTLQRMQQSGEQGARTGIEIALELVQQVRAFAGGIYLIPSFNRFDHAAEIIEAVRRSLSLAN